MKKHYLLFMLLFVLISNAQNYDNIANYSISGTPVNGVKIKTNLPFLMGSQMPTITIKGYNYGTSEPINLTIVYYIYFGGPDSSDISSYYFHQPKMSSSGSYTPTVYLSNENGKVVIFIDDKVYYQRFTVSAYAKGMSETSDWFQGWTAVDEPMTGTKTAEIPYQNRFKGNVYLSGNGIWNATGNVGIGTETPDAKLAVNGTIHSKEVKVDMNGWSDFVFKKEYNLPTLVEVEKHIKEKGHLENIPSEDEVVKNGINLGEMNAKLLQKIEEMTLYMIEQEKKNLQQSQEIELLNRKLSKIEELISSKSN